MRVLQLLLAAGMVLAFATRARGGASASGVAAAVAVDTPAVVLCNCTADPSQIWKLTHINTGKDAVVYQTNQSGFFS